ncbi:MAG: preprotein translocase subunit SecE [Bdellovibrionales bacterium CG10_big_fil_rev_8_21_14_0_10_45_34]|nr:MAG: preprotein translocase subunit SecE [Bdellovibrionales bacterium CG10_big_fil_rev_8_21_14_0_10_45_34]
MEENNQKAITISLALFSIMVAYTVFSLLQTAAGTFGVVARWLSNDFVRHGIPVVAGLSMFAGLYLRKGFQTWAEEVVVEVKKVVWPSRRDTVAMTVAVCIMVIISGVILGIFDFVSGQFINYMLSL